MGLQAGDQLAMNCHRARVIEQVRSIGAQGWRQRAGYRDRFATGRRRLPRQAPGPLGKRQAMLGKTRLANMKRHHRIAVAGDDPRTGVDERLVGPQHILRCLDQRQCRPFRLPERRANALQLAPHATIEQSQGRPAHGIALTVGAVACNHWSTVLAWAWTQALAATSAGCCPFSIFRISSLSCAGSIATLRRNSAIFGARCCNAAEASTWTLASGKAQVIWLLFSQSGSTVGLMNFQQPSALYSGSPFLLSWA
ncbi:hypothetical protein D3C81_1511660 [compost metagenome]